MAEAYTPTRQIVATERFEADLSDLANKIQAEYDSRGLNCYVQSVWKIRGETQDTVVVETLAPSGSPISETIVMGIILIVLAIIGTVVIYIAASFLERWFNFREKRWEELFHDIIVGLTHTSVEDLVKYKMENHPEEYAKRPYHCPYCGAQFETETARDDHIKMPCPEAPPPAPKAPEPKEGALFPNIQYLISVIGYRWTILLTRLRGT